MLPEVYKKKIQKSKKSVLLPQKIKNVFLNTNLSIRKVS